MINIVIISIIVIGVFLIKMMDKVYELERRIDKLEGYVSSMSGYMANENII